MSKSHAAPFTMCCTPLPSSHASSSHVLHRLLLPSFYEHSWWDLAATAPQKIWTRCLSTLWAPLATALRRLKRLTNLRTQLQST